MAVVKVYDGRGYDIAAGTFLETKRPGRRDALQPSTQRRASAARAGERRDASKCLICRLNAGCET